MNKRKIIIVISIILFLTIILIVVNGCTSNTNKDSGEVDTENNYISSGEIVATEDDLLENTELYISTKGYELMYDFSKFQIILEDNKEKFKYVQDETKDELYFMVEIIESGNKENIKNELIQSADVVGNCEITKSDLKGIYTQKDNGNIEKQNLIFELNENKMIIIEINKYKEYANDSLANKHFKNMIKTFKYNG